MNPNYGGHTYRISFDAWIGKHKYSPKFTVQQRFPVTRTVAKQLSRDIFEQEYLHSRRMLRRLRVTSVVKV